MMLCLFGVLLFLLAVASYFLFKKEILSPSFVLSLGFFFCNLFSIIGNLSWSQNVSFFSVVTLFLMIFLVFIGELFASINRRKVTQLGTGFISRTSEKNHGQQAPIIYNKTIFLFFLILQLVLLFFYQKRLLEMARDVGEVDGIGAFLQNIRIAIVIRGDKIGTFFSIFGNLSQALCYFSLFILFSNFEGKKPFRYIFSNLYLFVPVLLFLFASLLSGARNGFITFFVVALVCYIFARKRKGKRVSLSKFLLVGGVSLVLFLVIFSIAGSLSMKMAKGNILDEICRYAGSSIVGFDVWLNGEWTSAFDGRESFWGMWHLAHILFPSVQESSEYLDAVVFPNGQGTNIFTAFRSFISDFGFIGSMIICFAIGFVYKKLLSISTDKITPTKVVLFGYLFYFLVYMLFTPSVTSAIGTSSQVTTLFWIIVTGYALFYRRKEPYLAPYTL